MVAANREKNPDLFDDELEERLALLGDLDVGYAETHVREGQAVHRILMKQTRYWIYFTVDDADWITVLACWHTSRRGGPPLDPT